MVDSIVPTPVAYVRAPVRCELAPIKLKTERFSTGAVGQPIGIVWGDGGEAWFTGGANAIGRIDESRKVTAFSPDIRKPPQRLTQDFPGCIRA